MDNEVNGSSDEVNPSVYWGKVVRPLRSVDPTQTEYQGMIELLEEGRSLNAQLFNKVGLCANIIEIAFLFRKVW